MIVVDASLTLHAVLPSDHQAPALNQFETWMQVGEVFTTPSLWLAECASGIRRAIYLRQVTEPRGQALLRSLESLNVEIYPVDLPLCESALSWAQRLGQSRAYDGIYLALAERLGVECWTSDRRLTNGARQLGVEWVRTI
ncbi:MAG: type II toxin-antitoxin system VapC family toxin [Chloroflexota bacterium]